MAALRFQMLGALRVWRGDVELDPGPRQQAAVLAVLLARAGQPVSRTELIDLIWEDDPPPSAVNVIHKYVGALRRLLEPDLAVRATGSYVWRHGDGYLFKSGEELDLAAFRELVRTARAGNDVDRFAEALALWRGPAGDGLGLGPNAEPIFVALNEEFVEACVAAAGLAVSLGRPDRVLLPLRLAVSMAPFDEAAHAALIACLGAAGHRAEALAVFRTVRARLARELGIEPGPALGVAHRHVLAHTLETAADPDSGDDGLVGRTVELAALREAVTAAFAGGTSVVIVEGGPGTGKTRLLQSAAAEADRRGALVVWGSCLESNGTPSMWPWVEVVSTIVDALPGATRERWLAGDLGRLVDPRTSALSWQPDGGAQFRMFEAVVALIGEVAAQRPVQLLIDDMHWGDSASLRLFGHLVTRLPSRTVIVGALRDRAPVPSEELSRLLGAVSRGAGHNRIRVGPLAVAEVAELVRRESGQDPGDAAAAIHARTAGNAFLVRELSRLPGGTWPTAGPSVPATVRDVIRTRLAQLDDGARSVVQIAALIGRQVGLRLLASAARHDVRTCLELMESLESHGLMEPVRDDPYTFAFLHDLVREAVAELLPARDAAVLHLHIAEAIEGSGSLREPFVEQLAHHLRASGPLVDPARTASALVRAGRSAMAKCAFEAAERQLQSAVQIASAGGLADIELSALLLMAALTWRQRENDGHYLELLERAEYLARKLGQEQRAADFLYVRSIAHLSCTREEQVRLVRRMLDLGNASTDPTIRAYGLLAWGYYQWEAGDIAEALRYLSEGNQVASRLKADRPRPDQMRVAPLLQALAEGMSGDLETARASFDDLRTAAGDDPYALTMWAHFASMTAAMAGDAGWARRATNQWTAADPEHLILIADPYLRVNRCWTRAMSGDDPAAAAVEAEKIVDGTLVDPPRFGVVFNYLLVAEMFLLAERTDQAGAVLARAEHFLDVHGQRYSEGMLLLLRARLQLARGETARVVRSAAELARARSAERGAHLFARRAEDFLSLFP